MINHAAPTPARSMESLWHLSNYVRVLYKRRWVAIPAFLLVFVSGTLQTIRAVPIYEARTQLLLERDPRRSTSIDTVLQDRDYGFDDDAFYATQHRIMQSRSLALRTVEALEKSGPPPRIPQVSGFNFSLTGLISTGISGVVSLVKGASGPPAGAVEPVAADETLAQAAKIDAFLGGLEIEPIRNSRLVDIVYRSPDPHYATRAANELANQYKNRNLESRFLASKEANDWLSEQLKEQRAKVEESEAVLVRYRETHNAGSVDNRQNIVVQKLTEMNAQVTRAKIERLDKEALYNQLVEVRNGGGSLDSVPAVMANEYIQKLKLEVSGLEEKRAQMAAQYGPNWPPMKELTNSIAIAQQRKAAEIDRIVEAVRNDFRAAQAKEQSLVQALEVQKSEALGLDRKAVEYAALEREAAGNRQLYENLMQRTKETGVSGQYRGSNIDIVDAAELPQSPVLPNTQRDMTMAALGGLVLAFALVFGFEYFDSRLKSPEEVKAHLGLPFLGLVPVAPGAKSEAPLLSGEEPRAFAEAIRGLRTALLFSSADEGARTLLITSTGPSEGKTVISSSLAITLAHAGQKTLVIDADMRRPRLHEALGHLQEPGMSNLLVGDSNIDEAIRKTSIPNLSLLPAGHIPPNPADLLGSKKYKDLLGEFKQRFDWIIIDAPPVLPVTDASVVAHTVGGVLFVVGAEMTSHHAASNAVDQLQRARAKMLGVVLNKVHVERHSYYYRAYYNKGYGKYYQRSATGA